MTLRDGLAAILVVTILGLAFVAIKVGLETVPPLMLCALRFGFAALPAALLIRPPRAPVALVAGFGMALGVGQFGLLMTAIRFGMPAGLSSLLIQVQVPFTVALAWAVQKERPRGLQMLGGGIALVGVAAVALGRGGGAPLGPLLLVVGAALAWASANVIVKRIGRVDRLALMVWGSLATTPPLLILSLIIEGPGALAGLTHPSWGAIGSVAFQAYPTTLLAFGLWSGLLTRYPAATVTPFALLVPVAGILSTHLVVGEPLSADILVGGGLILAGIALSLRGGRTAADPSARAKATAPPEVA
ncbi:MULTISPECIES: EamA family transporter [Methylobacterium]|uniref:EamA family transporter n=1 Tax=Methylobacterium longum TaxID=767694 RepID=A0ABT8ANB0_9HYPH|nr:MULTISPECIES: EamA family transporter [Methylobacterium]MCJ2103553.1 EamA family transporter [Methylobacterium sp. E-046]MDN3571326.1 EamA family transporter [Methylobacterium longum]GJE09180.1 putative amino-acid metabolite efflux pump [Methylobacterium longum]